MNIKLTKSQWQRVSELSGNLGILVCGSIIIPFWLEKSYSLGVIRGLLAILFLW